MLESGARPFLDYLREHRMGLTHAELSEAMQQLVAAVVAERKGGEITLKISVKPQGDGAVMVTDEVKLKLPKPTKGGSLFFVTPENNLVRQDPRQADLPLHAIGDRKEAISLGPPASVARGLA